MGREPKAPRAWQRMLSGRRLDLLNPSPLDIEIEDIAHGLARVARWNGQTKGAHAFSVAQHSLLVEQIASHFEPDLDRPARLAALLHDAPEYVIGDMISPFKAALGVDYKDFEHTLLSAIHIRFGLPARPPPALTRKIKALGTKVSVAATGRVTVIDKDGGRHVYVLVLDTSTNTSPLTQALADLERAAQTAGAS